MNHMMRVWSLSFLLLVGISLAFDSDYDEVVKFNELLEVEKNPLAVLFTEECCTCTSCVEAEVLIGGMSKELEENLDILVVRLKKPDLRSRYGVKTVPSLVYIRNNKAALYEGRFELDELYAWLQKYKDPLTVDLDDETFEHLTQAASGATTGDWLVIFHDGSCCKNRELIFLETAGIRLKNKVNVASVNIKSAAESAERFKITSCPSIIFFRHQKMYRFSLPDVTVATLRRFAEGFYKNSKAENVPLPQSTFDKFLDKFMHLNYVSFLSLVLVATVIVFAASFLIHYCCKSASHKKKE